jgi:hypothetical protein
VFTRRFRRRIVQSAVIAGAGNRPGLLRMIHVRESVMIAKMLSVITVLAAVAASGTPSYARGYGFRNFKSNPPRAGEKAPVHSSIDENGKPVDMSDLMGNAHLIVVFGALT